MIALSHRRTRINFVSHFDRPRFWSVTDTDSVRSYLRSVVDKTNSRIIEVNLSGMRDFDPLFGEDVFAGLIKYTTQKFKGNKTVVFSGLRNDMLYYFRYALQKRKQWSVITQREGPELIGEVPYVFRVLFRKLYNYSPVASDVVCQEIGERKDVCLSQLDAFVNMGLAIKCYGTGKKEIYTGIVRRRDVYGLVRYIAKRIKISFLISPLYYVYRKQK